MSGHYGTGRNADKLKDSAPKRHTTSWDVDNAMKFILDSMNGVFFRDDRQIYTARITKAYSSEKGSQGMVIIIDEK